MARTFSSCVVGALLACASVANAMAVTIQNSTPCTANAGVNPTPFMCYTDGRSVTISPGQAWSSGNIEGCTVNSAGASLSCHPQNSGSFSCTGSPASKTSYTITANSNDPANVTSCIVS